MDLWRKIDGKQDVKVYLRSLRHIIEDLVVFLGQIGTGHVLRAIVVFQDGSWVKMNLSCEPLYGVFKSCFKKNFSN